PTDLRRPPALHLLPRPLRRRQWQRRRVLRRRVVRDPPQRRDALASPTAQPSRQTFRGSFRSLRVRKEPQNELWGESFGPRFLVVAWGLERTAERLRDGIGWPGRLRTRAGSSPSISS